MGLFGKKEDKNGLPPLQFPELPKTVPSFDEEAETADIKKAVMPEIPKQNISYGLPKSFGVEQPLFVKIEKYKDVVETLSKLKGRLGEAENILNKLTRLKDEEDREIAAWHNDLEKIRMQLMEIDRKLFE